MTATTDLLPNKLRMTADIEDMAGRTFTANQLREAVAEIERLQAEVADMQRLLTAAHNSMARQYQRIEALERDLSIEIDAGHDSTERAEAAEAERDELRAKWAPLVKWAAGKEKAGKGES